MSEYQSQGRLTTGTPSTVRISSLFSAVFDWQIPTNHLCGENFAALFPPLPLPPAPCPASCGQVWAGGQWGDWGGRRSPVWLAVGRRLSCQVSWLVAVGAQWETGGYWLTGLPPPVLQPCRSIPELRPRHYTSHTMHYIYTSTPPHTGTTVINNWFPFLFLTISKKLKFHVCFFLRIQS